MILELPYAVSLFDRLVSLIKERIKFNQEKLSEAEEKMSSTATCEVSLKDYERACEDRDRARAELDLLNSYLRLLGDNQASIIDSLEGLESQAEFGESDWYLAYLILIKSLVIDLQSDNLGYLRRLSEEQIDSHFRRIIDESIFLLLPLFPSYPARNARRRYSDDNNIQNIQRIIRAFSSHMAGCLT